GVALTLLAGLIGGRGIRAQLLCLLAADFLVFLLLRLVVAAEALLESTNGLAEIRTEVADLLGAEDHQHDRQKDEPMPHAVKTHFNLSGRFQPNRAGANRADNYCEVY